MTSTMNIGRHAQYPLTDLNRFHKNARRGDVEAIMGSIVANGVYRPIYVNKGTYTGRPLEVLAGNHTLEAMRRLAEQNPEDPRWRQTAAPAKRVATSAKSQNKKGNMSARRLMLHNFEYVPPVGTKNPRRKPMDRAPKKKVKRPTRK